MFTHDISRNKLAYFDRNIPPLEEQIEIVEKMGSYQRECRVLGISLFAAGMGKQEIHEIIHDMEIKYRIPVFAPMVTGCRKFTKILEEFK